MKKLVFVSCVAQLALSVVAADGVLKINDASLGAEVNWATAALWKDGYIPGSGDDIYFTNAMTRTIHVRLPATDTSFGKITGWPGIILNGYTFGKNYTIVNPGNFEGCWRMNYQNTLTLASTVEHVPVLGRLCSEGGPRVNVAEYPAAISNAYGIGFIHKTGNGALAVKDPTGDFSMFVDGGDLSLEPGSTGAGVDVSAVLARAKFWFDASDGKSMAIENGHVTVWTNRNGGTEHATSTIDSPYGVVQGPVYVPNFQNGLGVLDFGPIYKANTSVAPDNGAAALLFPRQAYVASCFMVAADRDPEKGRNTIFGDSDDARWDRTSEGGIMKSDGHASSADGELRVNGRRVSPIFQLSGTNELKVIALRTNVTDSRLHSGYAPLGRIAANSKNGNSRFTIGGLRVGEYLIFNGYLSDAEFRAVNDYLMNKWLPGGAKKQGVDTLVLAEGVDSVSVPNGHIAVNRLKMNSSTLSKTGGGTLDIGTVETDSERLDVEVEAGSVAFSGMAMVTCDAVAPSPLYHFDASADSFTFADGLSISRWADVRGEGHVDMVSKVNFMTGSKEFPCRLPTVVSNALNGLSVVDFGVRVAGNSRTESTATTLFSNSSGMALDSEKVSSSIYNVREGFYVAKKRIAGTFVLSSSFSCYDFHYGESSTLLNIQYGGMGLRGGKWTLDGEPVDPSLAKMPADTWHLCRFSATEKVRFSSFAWDRPDPFNFGGVQIAEVVLYDRELTDAERMDTEAYLLMKWFNKPHPRAASPKMSIRYAAAANPTFENSRDMAVDYFAVSDAALAKAGDGKLNIGVLDGATSISVTGGDLTVQGVDAVLAKAAFHVDPSRTNTMSFAENDYGTYVSEWRDVRTNGMYATAYADTARKPTLRENYEGANGLTVVDFGVRTDWGDRNKGESVTRGRGMDWNQRILGLKEVYMVVSDHPDSWRTSFLLGDTSSYDFHRADFWTLLQPTYSSQALQYGSELTVDAETITTEGNVYDMNDKKFHLVTFAITNGATVKAGTFSRDRSQTIGGILMGEYVLFTNSLTACERSMVRDYLLRKWKATPLMSHSYDSLAAIEGASLSVAAPEVRAGSVAGTVSVSGDFAFSSPAAFIVDYTADGRCTAFEVSGTADLTATGTMTIRIADGAPPTERPLPILIADGGLEGSLSGWRIAVEGATAAKYSISVSASGGTVFLSVAKKGLTVVIR